jgi:hypothetical protein
MASWTDKVKLFLDLPWTPESLAPRQVSDLIHTLSGVCKGYKPPHAQK